MCWGGTGEQDRQFLLHRGLVSCPHRTSCVAVGKFLYFCVPSSVKWEQHSVVLMMK